MSTKVIWSTILLLIVIFIGLIIFASVGESPTTNVEVTNNQDSAMNESEAMGLASPAFTNNGTIPEQFTCDGDNVSPPLSISRVPEGTRSLALIMDDPDIPEEVQGSLGSDVFDHWVVFNIQPTPGTTAEPAAGQATINIQQGEAPGVEGRNSSGEVGYTGPCPPPQYEPTEHRYIFTLYALDEELGLPEGASKIEVLEAMEGHILTQTELVGRYDRAK